MAVALGVTDVLPVIAPGIAGTVSCGSMITFPDDAEVHPDALATVKLYVPAGSPDMVVLLPDPEVVVPPGFLVSVQLPAEGKPPRVTLPVGNMHVGCMIVPTVGAEGVAGCTFIPALVETAEVHPVASVTLKV